MAKCPNPDCAGEVPAGNRVCPQCATPIDAPTGAASDAVGTVVDGKYRLLAKLGQGGMGAVWRAEHVLLGHRRAIKMLLPTLAADATSRRRFLNEAKALTALDHSAIVRAYDLASAPDGRLYLVMELVEGASLLDRLRERRTARRSWDLDEARGLILRILEAAEYAHGQGVVHRDLKPEHILLPAGGGAGVKVLDFGIARLRPAGAGPAAEPGGGGTTSAGWGTPPYMSPEQVRGESGDARSDLYAIGAMLYELLAGRPVFDGDGDYRLREQTVHAAPRALAELRPDLPPPFCAVVMRALEKAPSQRHPSAAEMRAALSAADGAAAVDIAPPRRDPVPPSVPKPAPEAIRAFEERLRAADLPARIKLVEALGRSGDPRLGRDPKEIPLVAVPAGRFRMGSTDAEIAQAVQLSKDDGVPRERKYFEDEQAPGVVSVPAFQIGTFPITNEQYHAFVAAGHRVPVAERAVGAYQPWKNGEPPADRGSHPVVGVDWADAVAYCRWLSDQTGLRYGLPTEAEWEYAARGTESRIFPWGATWKPGLANDKSAGQNGTTPVGLFLVGAGPCGALDLAGNVWEWCSSRYAKYPYAPDEAHEAATGEGGRVVRGGAWTDPRFKLRAAYRSDPVPATRDAHVGFRVAVRAGV